MTGREVKAKLLSQGYILADVAKKMGVIPQTLNSLLQANDIKTGVLEKIANAINKSAYFFYESDEQNPLCPDIQTQFTLRTDRTIDMQSVPLYELDATAGLVALFADQTRRAPICHIQIPDLPPCDGAVYVRGDSMYPLLKSGDIVLYKEIPKRVQRYPVGGDVSFVIHYRRRELHFDQIHSKSRR